MTGLRGNCSGWNADRLGWSPGGPAMPMTTVVYDRYDVASMHVADVRCPPGQAWAEARMEPSVAEAVLVALTGAAVGGWRTGPRTYLLCVARSGEWREIDSAYPPTLMFVRDDDGTLTYANALPYRNGVDVTERVVAVTTPS